MSYISIIRDPHDIIKSRKCDKAKDIRFAMFDIFGKNLLTCINTSAGAENIANFKNQLRCYSY